MMILKNKIGDNHLFYFSFAIENIIIIIVPKKFAFAKIIGIKNFTMDIIYSIIIVKNFEVIVYERDKKGFLLKSINKKRW